MRTLTITSAVFLAMLVPFAAEGAEARLRARDVSVEGGGVKLSLVVGEQALAKKQAAKKPRTTRPAARGARRTRAPGRQHPPDPAVRRATAGPGAPETASAGVESAELEALRQAERDLFGPDVQGSQGAPECPSPLLPGAAGPLVQASGLPPTGPTLLAPAPEPQLPAFVSSLRMPDVPVRWSARVLQYLDFYKNDPRGRTIAAIWYRKSGGFEPMLREVLRRHGVPEDIMWVAVVESGLRPTVYSPAGAAGLWQFMPESGRLYGLVVDRWVDERLDPVRSTHAAAMYLQDLHRRFGTWELALAAYNMGFGGLLGSVRKYNTNDFWELSRYEAGIPWETTLYVPKILALMVVAKNPEVFGLGNQQRDPPAEFDEIDVAPGVSLEAVAKAAGVDLADIEQLNPQLLASRVPPRSPSRAAAGVWRIRVPKGHAAKVNENLVKTRASEVRLQPHIVRQGESLADVARVYGTTEARLARDNALRSDEVPRPGTVLLVPPRAASSAKGESADPVVVVVPLDLRAPAGHRRLFYQVVPGDTLEGVAEAFTVPPDDLRRWNGLDTRARLHAGMSMMVIVPNAQDTTEIKTLGEEDVRLLVVGTDAFFAYFEGLKGRVRTTTAVRAGEDWRALSRRTGLSVGMLERINRKSRRTALQQGETLVVYLPANQVPQPPVRADESEDTGRATSDTPEPDDTAKQDTSPASIVPPASP